MAEQRYFEGVGRRKEASARVRIYPGGEGQMVVNDRAMEEYFVRDVDVDHLLEPLKVTGTQARFNVSVHVNGGGIAGQAGAVRLGIARALIEWDPELRPTLRRGGFLTRDARKKERKKPGLKRARKAPQYTKR
jgi:small subunit ribosomal protein S9